MNRARAQAPQAWRWLRGAGAVLLAVAALEYGVVPFVLAARTSLDALREVSWAPLAAALLLETASLAAYTRLTQTLLPASERLSFGTQWRIDLVGYGLAHALPGGGATSAAVRVRLMTARGVATAEALSLSVSQFLVSAAGLVAVWLLGALMSVPRTGLTAATVVLVLGAVVLTVALELGARAAGRSEGSPRLPGALDAVPLLPPRWRDVVWSTVLRIRRSLSDPSTGHRGLTWAFVNWLLDAVCLWLCLRAYGGAVPVELVLASYGLVNVVGLLPITPGGIGVIEGLLVPAIVASGATATVAVLGVLTWRLLQYWLPLPVAALCYATLATPRHRLPRRVVPTP